jgi:hypothetical protein
MKVLLASLLLAACATAPQRSPLERVAGCWISRDIGAVTMRWLPEPAQPGTLQGTRIDYNESGAARHGRYTLEPSGEGFALCELDSEGAAAVSCWQVASGEGGSLEGGRAFIDAHGDRLRITVLGAGPEQLIFQGRRDGCD